MNANVEPMTGSGARSIYIASAEGDTGKSTVAVGLLETLTASVSRVGVFRPIVRADVDKWGRLIREARLNIEP